MSVMYPERGQQAPDYWDVQLRQWIDQRVGDVGLLDPGVSALVGDAGSDTATAMEQFVQDRIAGTELGYAERTTSFATTNLSTASGGIIPGLSVSVVGTGRPVDIEFFGSIAYHSVASTAVNANLSVGVNGGTSSTTSNFSQSAIVRSTVNATGPVLFLRRRALLAAGSTYAFTVNISGGAAGTSNVVAAAYAPTYLSVTSR